MPLISAAALPVEAFDPIDYDEQLTDEWLPADKGRKVHVGAPDCPFLSSSLYPCYACVKAWGCVGVFCDILS